MPDLPLNMWADMLSDDAGRRGRRVSVLMGFCSHEGTGFVPEHAGTNADFRAFFAELLPSFSAADLDALEALYPDPATGRWSPYSSYYANSSSNLPMGRQFHRLHEAYAHYAYICPIFHTAHLLSVAGANVYIYEYAALSAAAPHRLPRLAGRRRGAQNGRLEGLPRSHRRRR